MKKIKTLALSFVVLTFTSSLAYSQQAPACDPQTAKILLNLNQQINYTRVILSNLNTSTGFATFSGSKGCTGTWRASATNFFGGTGNAGSALTGNFEIAFTAEFDALGTGVKRFMMGFLQDTNGSGTFVFVSEADGTSRIWNVGGTDLYEFSYK